MRPRRASVGQGVDSLGRRPLVEEPRGSDPDRYTWVINLIMAIRHIAYRRTRRLRELAGTARLNRVPSRSGRVWDHLGERGFVDVRGAVIVGWLKDRVCDPMFQAWMKRKPAQATIGLTSSWTIGIFSMRCSSIRLTISISRIDEVVSSG